MSTVIVQTSRLVRIIHKSIHVVEDGEVFLVVSYVNGRYDCEHRCKTKEEANAAAEALAYGGITFGALWRGEKPGPREPRAAERAPDNDSH